MMKYAGIVLLITGLQGCTILGSVLDSQLGIERSGAQRATLKDAGNYLDSAILDEIQNDSSGGCANLSGAEKNRCYVQARSLNDKIKKHREQH